MTDHTLERTRGPLRAIAEEAGLLSANVSVLAKPLTPEEAIGTPGRRDFPILSQTVRGKPLVFLDSGASAQKPRQVIEAMVRCMETAYANVHRGAYHLSEQATEAYEAARGAVARFLNAPDAREVVFTRNSTEAINLVAHGWGRGVLFSLLFGRPGTGSGYFTGGSDHDIEGFFMIRAGF